MISRRKSSEIRNFAHFWLYSSIDSTSHENCHVMFSTFTFVEHIVRTRNKLDHIFFPRVEVDSSFFEDFTSSAMFKSFPYFEVTAWKLYTSCSHTQVCKRVKSMWGRGDEGEGFELTSAMRTFPSTDNELTFRVEDEASYSYSHGRHFLTEYRGQKSRKETHQQVSFLPFFQHDHSLYRIQRCTDNKRM
jgi:hypothetical protein